MNIVTCNGCFDGLHPGHLFFLGYCRALGDKLIIGINHDDHIRQTKGREPFYTAEERMKALMNLDFVSDVIIFKERIPNKFIKDVNPDVHCTGEEYGWDCPESPICKELGIKLVLIPRIRFWSTSKLDEINEKFVASYMQRLLYEK